MKTPMKSVRQSRNFRTRRRQLLSIPIINQRLYRKDNKLSNVQVQMLKEKGIKLTVNNTERDALKFLKAKKK